MVLRRGGCCRGNVDECGGTSASYGELWEKGIGVGGDVLVEVGSVVKEVRGRGRMFQEKAKTKSK